MPSENGADVWLFALVGLLSTAMLGGFLLTVTGRTLALGWATAWVRGRCLTRTGRQLGARPAA